MSRIAVAMVSLPSLLFEIVDKTIEDQPDMEVVARYEDLRDASTDNRRMDAVITSIDDPDVRELKRFFLLHPEMVVINFSRSADAGEILRLEITQMALDDPSPTRLVQAIRHGVAIAHGQ